MALAGMVKLYESDLICDLAETYHILNYRALPLRLVAVLACGLREDSRVLMRISGARVQSDVMLMASAVDRLSLLVWFQTKDGQRGRNRPQSLLTTLAGDKKQSIESFDSAEEFDAARARILSKGG